jgi:hypothetical protein
VDYVEVRWPSGIVQRLERPEIKRIVEIVEGK